MSTKSTSNPNLRYIASRIAVAMIRERPPEHAQIIDIDPVISFRKIHFFTVQIHLLSVAIGIKFDGVAIFTVNGTCNILGLISKQTIFKAPIGAIIDKLNIRGFVIRDLMVILVRICIRTIITKQTFCIKTKIFNST